MLAEPLLHEPVARSAVTAAGQLDTKSADTPINFL